MRYNEADTRAKLINPKLHEADWSENLIKREITAGTESQKKKKRQVLRFILSTNIYTYTQCFFSGNGSERDGIWKTRAGGKIKMTNGETEKRLWDVANNLRANSKLSSAEYSTPVLGLIFLRYVLVQ